MAPQGLPAQQKNNNNTIQHDVQYHGHHHAQYKNGGHQMPIAQVGQKVKYPGEQEADIADKSNTGEK